MKNVFTFIAFIIVLVFSSCTKEELVHPEIFNASQADYVEQSTERSIDAADDTAVESNLVTSVEVTVLASSQSNGELIVDFSSTHDFTNAELLGTQQLVLVDSNNNESTLTFSVNSDSYNGSVLQVVFDVAANNLSGLSLRATQSIVIDDDMMN